MYKKNGSKERATASIRKVSPEQGRSQWDELEGRVTEFTGSKTTWREEEKDNFFLNGLYCLK